MIFGRRGGVAAEQERQRARDALLREIDRDAHETAGWTGRERFSERVMAAIAAVPREQFAAFGSPASAYANVPFPIGSGQTISQPYIVALMTDLLDPEPKDIVLEIGTGSGYQAAVLSLLVHRVFSVEVVPELAKRSAELLRRLGYDNVDVREGDGSEGCAEHAPFDGIVVTAAASEIPGALVEQLAPGGRLVIPVGEAGMAQELVVVEKDSEGRINRRHLLPVAFVPLTRR